MWRRPLPRMLIVAPAATTSVSRSLVATGTLLPRRLAEVWQLGKSRSLSLPERMRLVLQSTLRGDDTSYHVDSTALDDTAELPKKSREN